jgi:hypothetical protein
MFHNGKFAFLQRTVGTNDKIVLQDFETPDKVLGCARDKSVHRKIYVSSRAKNLV